MCIRDSHYLVLVGLSEQLRRIGLEEAGQILHANAAGLGERLHRS